MFFDGGYNPIKFGYIAEHRFQSTALEKMLLLVILIKIGKCKVFASGNINGKAAKLTYAGEIVYTYTKEENLFNITLIAPCLLVLWQHYGHGTP